MKRMSAWLLLGTLALSACGKSEQQKQAEEAAKQIEAAAKEASKAAEQAGKASGQAATDAAKGFEAMAKGLGAMIGGATGDNAPVDPVSFRDLQALFPTLDGWEQGKPTGERVTAPFRYSNAEVTYTKGNSRISLKLADSGFNQLLFAPFAMLIQTGYEKETQDGYEKSTTIAGQPAFEKWNSERKDGEITAVVGKRFLVSIDGNNIDDIKALHEVAGKVDMAKLAALK
jgi:hypothetical protein